MYSFGYNAKGLSSRVCVRDGSGALPIFFSGSGSVQPDPPFSGGTRPIKSIRRFGNLVFDGIDLNYCFFESFAGDC